MPPLLCGKVALLRVCKHLASSCAPGLEESKLGDRMIKDWPSLPSMYNAEHLSLEMKADWGNGCTKMPEFL